MWADSCKSSGYEYFGTFSSGEFNVEYQSGMQRPFHTRYDTGGRICAENSAGLRGSDAFYGVGKASFFFQVPRLRRALSLFCPTENLIRKKM